MWKCVINLKDPALFHCSQMPSDPERPEHVIAAELNSSPLPSLCLPVPHVPRSLPDHTGLQNREAGPPEVKRTLVSVSSF